MTDVPLQSLTPLNEVSNVCVFICDSLRIDYLPQWIRQRGVTVESVAPSSATKSSIPSLVTGQYPSTHGVWSFHDELPTVPPILDYPHSYKADTVWTHMDPQDKPPIKMTHASSGKEVSELNDGFVYIEHDKGGHSPYGYPFEQHSTPSFYRTLSDSDDIKELYRNSVSSSADRFNDLLQRLESSGILDETLVVFTSDHGEVLGEQKYGGLYGHGSPIVPETVRTPLVFIGAGLPEGRKLDYLGSGTDIAPTILGAMSSADLPNADGTDLWRNIPTDRTPRSELWKWHQVCGKPFDYYKVTSAWSKEGGVVRHFDSKAARIPAAILSHYYKLPSATRTRKNISVETITGLFRTYGPTVRTYGNAGGIETDLSQVEFPDSPQFTQRQYSKESLRQLGYIE